MARYEVYPNPAGAGYLLDVQADLLDGLNTRVVVPLLPPDAAPLPARRLNPLFDIAETPHVMVTQFMAAVPLTMLGRPVSSLIGRDTEITNALDMLLSGI
ncbi:plasmid maintenance protein CcdB [Haematobacter missouriensis]|uniref:Toxin CcdB n=1 Tax=Haematobacter missouriensis TaxID=366616 RepID=A0A212ALK1_9RHOB|nr:CcdB family protein [Haematobacter missouriensis]KFI32425.1 plasmid maintenance protein CcdB [Haematobacter missouriensis]OWJ76504.1 plasmid maintenance protein CcdB [Haematobacter missouriensis]OWJ82226.1 plasmid maintenance protein CcdB [Haematobacter missouriensis]